MSNTTFTTPGEDRYFEDYVPNTVHEIGPFTLDPDEVNSFVKRYASQNPQTDPKSAKKTTFESLVAIECPCDGLLMRLIADYYLPEAGDLNSVEIDELRWVRPVCSKDELIIRVTVAGVFLPSYEPNRRIVYSSIEVLNQNRVEVMTMKMKNTLFCCPK